MITVEQFKSEISFIAKQLNVTPKEIQIRDMKKKWGSCSKRVRVTFDKSLLEQPKEFRYQIILHELLHLRYHNHGKMFKILNELDYKKIINNEHNHS